MTLLLDSPLTSAITGFDAITANGAIYGGQDCIDGLVSIPGYLDIVTAPDGQTAMRSRITGSDALTYGGIRSEVDWTPDTGERWYVFDVYLPRWLEVYYDGYKVAQEWSQASGYSDAVGPYIKLGLYDLFHVGFGGERTVYYRNIKVYGANHSVNSILGRRPRSRLPFLLG